MSTAAEVEARAFPDGCRRATSFKTWCAPTRESSRFTPRRHPPRTTSAGFPNARLASSRRTRRSGRRGRVRQLDPTAFRVDGSVRPPLPGDLPHAGARMEPPRLTELLDRSADRAQAHRIAVHGEVQRGVERACGAVAHVKHALERNHEIAAGAR